MGAAVAAVSQALDCIFTVKEEQRTVLKEKMFLFYCSPVLARVWLNTATHRSPPLGGDVWLIPTLVLIVSLKRLLTVNVVSFNFLPHFLWAFSQKNT